MNKDIRTFILVFLTLSALAIIFTRSPFALKTTSASFNIQSLYKDEFEPGATFSVQILATDLRRVCIHEENSSYKCTYFDYWTNKTGKWQKLQRENGGTEGFNFCEYFERWKVAKGMSCTRLASPERPSVVNFK